MRAIWLPILQYFRLPQLYLDESYDASTEAEQRDYLSTLYVL